jgi:iron complex outermembrane receptor protein
VPISDKWAARLAYANIDRKGFSTNGGNDAVASGFRAKALYKDGDNLSVLLGYEHNILGGKGNQGTKLADFSAGNYYYSAGSTDIRQDYTADKYYAEVTMRMGPGNLTFLPAYQYGEGYVCDDMMGLDCNWDPKSSPQTSVDLRYSSLSDSAVQWATGLYYYGLKNHSTMTGPGGVKGDSRTKTDSFSIYGQATFPLAENLRGIAGLRSGNDKKSYSNPLSTVTSDSAKYTSVDYKLGLEYDVAKDSMAYVTLASGHRPGGFNSLPGATNHSFEAEKLSSLEIGSKNRFMGGKVQLNAAAYYYDYSNFQYTDFVITPGGPEFTITNVGKVRNMGLELEGKARVADNTVLTGSIAALRSTYASPSFVHADPFSPAVDLNGKVMPHAPKLTMKVGIEQNFDFDNGSSLTAKVDARHTSDQFVAIFPGEDQTQKAYAEVDASLLYRPASDAWSLNIYGRNLTNKVAKMALFGDEIFAGTPRMYGVSLTVKY